MMEELSDYELLSEIRERPKRKAEPAVPKATSERQLFVQQTADMLRVPFKVVLWKTINWPTTWIREFYFYCMKNGNPPARLWYGLYKKNVKPRG